MWKVEFLPIIPLGAALLLALVPAEDIRTRNQTSFILQFFWLGLILFLNIHGFLNLLQTNFMGIQGLALLSVHSKKSSALLPPLFWILMSLSTASILSPDLPLALLFSFLHVVVLFFIILQTGGLYKGSTSYESILFFMTIDLCAFFSLSILSPWAYWVLLLPGLARVLFPLASPYAMSVFYNCPTEIIILMLGGMIPLGLSLLQRIPGLCPELDLLEVICVGSSLFALTLFLIEKSRRQRAIHLFMIQSPLCASLILRKHDSGIWAALLAMVNSIVWLYFLDMPRVRYFNIALTAVTLYWLAVQL